ncbi:MAG: hypothetical protein ACP5IZ_09190, partial [Thermoprotei archaeon]
EVAFEPPKKVYKYKPKYKLHHFSEDLTGWKPYKAYTLEMEEYEKKLKEMQEDYNKTTQEIDEMWEKEGIEKISLRLSGEVVSENDIPEVLHSLLMDKMYFIYTRALMPFLWLIWLNFTDVSKADFSNRMAVFVNRMKAVAYELKKLHEYWGNYIDESILPYDEVSKMDPNNLKIDDFVRFLEAIRRFVFEFHAPFLATLIEKARNGNILASSIIMTVFSPYRKEYTIYWRSSKIDLDKRMRPQPTPPEINNYVHRGVVFNQGPFWRTMEYLVKWTYFQYTFPIFFKAGEYILTRVRDLRPPNCYIEDFYHDYLLAKMRNDEAYAEKVAELFRQYLMNAQNMVDEYVDVEGEIRKLKSLNVERDHDLIPINIWYWILDAQKFSTGYEVFGNDAWFIGNNERKELDPEYSLPGVTRPISDSGVDQLYMKFRSIFPENYSSDAFSLALGMYAHGIWYIHPLGIEIDAEYDDPYPNRIGMWIRWNLLLYTLMQSYNESYGYFIPKPKSGKEYYMKFYNMTKNDPSKVPILAGAPFTPRVIELELPREEAERLRHLNSERYYQFREEADRKALRILNEMLRKLDNYEVDYEFLFKIF